MNGSPVSSRIPDRSLWQRLLCVFLMISIAFALTIRFSTGLARADCMDDCKKAIDDAANENLGDSDNFFKNIYDRVKRDAQALKQCETSCLNSISNELKNFNPLGSNAHGEQAPDGVRIDVNPTGRTGDLDSLHKDALKLLHDPGS